MALLHRDEKKGCMILGHGSARSQHFSVLAVTGLNSNKLHKQISTGSSYIPTACIMHSSTHTGLASRGRGLASVRACECFCRTLSRPTAASLSPICRQLHASNARLPLRHSRQTRVWWRRPAAATQALRCMARGGCSAVRAWARRHAGSAGRSRARRHGSRAGEVAPPARLRRRRAPLSSQTPTALPSASRSPPWSSTSRATSSQSSASRFGKKAVSSRGRARCPVLAGCSK
mmetsp:Transcript_21251/g.46311  ORF Transcript_21251/g.46311 Transcript_21251/m.46311 type:complete len:232 (+) Transcript_21251:513-1208(+)